MGGVSSENIGAGKGGRLFSRGAGADFAVSASVGFGGSRGGNGFGGSTGLTFGGSIGGSGGKFNATSVLLEPLNETESGELVRNLLGRAQLAADVRARVTEAAEGNPLFVEEKLERPFEHRVGQLAAAERTGERVFLQ